MRKIVLFVLLTALAIPAAKSQTYIKANALYYAVLVPNIAVETKLSEHFTFNADAVFSPWKSINGSPYLIGQIIPDVRYYFKEANQGFYAGLYAAADVYKVSKWGHPGTDVQHGWGISLGATVGYELPIAKRWLMDFYIGGGWHHGWYWGEDTRDGSVYAPWNRSGEWIPYRAGVSFGYRLGKKK